jgi:hypothetical protein
MIKKIFLILIIFLCFNNSAFSKEISVKVIPDSEISTSDGSLQEGDSINLIIVEDVYVNTKLYIKKGEPVVGIITSLVNNDFTCQNASIYAENFKAKNVDGKIVKLNGIVHKEGRNHSYFTQYMPDNPMSTSLFFFIRGGEAKIVPQKDSFILYLDDGEKREAKNDL